MKIDLKTLNNAQSEAVRCTEGTSLIIAGAGSGKTKVLTYKIAYLLEQGIQPSSILALTFTNKASKEMKERIAALVGRDKSVRLWMGTFHSIFIRFLRAYSDRLNYPTSFTVYDSSDTRSAIRACIKELELDEKVYKPNEVQSRISYAKNNLVTAAAYMNNQNAINNDMVAKKGRICEIYALYAKKCFAAGVMDFDDILLNMNILLRDFPDVCDNLQHEFKYIFVDEYQDTNYAQYLIIKKLSQIHKNITVVGDDSQSIYGFRGARIENILNFKKDYPESKEFRLEQNYRSTQTIVKAANSLITKNSNRLNKECFSQGPMGEKVGVIKAFTEQDEGMNVASSIVSRIYSEKASYDQFAVLYRTNAQSRIIEEMLRKKNLPYKIYAGHSFFERAEVKDMLAYLRMLVNPRDDEAFKRIVNFPARGIGDTSLKALTAAATGHNTSLWDAVFAKDLEDFGLRAASIAKMRSFASMIASLSSKIETSDAYQLAIEAANVSGVLATLKNDNSIESQAKFENVQELLNSVNDYVEDQKKTEAEVGNEDALITLNSYIENVALITDMESSEEKNGDDNKVKLMTVHASKGLEFDYVYIIGMEENLFPSMSSTSSENDVEEERRLFYVALTRAKKVVSVSFSRSRFRWGQHVNYPPSRFLKEIDQQYLSEPIKDEPIAGGVGSGFGFDDDDTTSWGSRNSSWRNVGKSVEKARSIPHERVESAKPTMSRPVQQADPNFVTTPSSELSVGMYVEHDRFGYGKIISLEGSLPNTKAVVDFEIGGKKTLLLKFAKLRKI